MNINQLVDAGCSKLVSLLGVYLQIKKSILNSAI
jgi:hypothetical protein